MPTMRSARRTAQRLKSRLKTSTPGMRRNGSCGTVQCHRPSRTCTGGLSAAVSLRQARLRSRPEVVGARSIVLGPEPVIGAQKVVLRLGERQLVVGTLGLGPFQVLTGEPTLDEVPLLEGMGRAVTP